MVNVPQSVLDNKEKSRAQKNRRAYILFAAAAALFKTGDSDAGETICHIAEAALHDPKMYARLGDLIVTEVTDRDMSTWEEWIGPPYAYGEKPEDFCRARENGVCSLKNKPGECTPST